jgi:hypothetical protein
VIVVVSVPLSSLDHHRANECDATKLGTEKQLDDVFADIVKFAVLQFSLIS